MAAITSAASGNWNAGGTWTGGVSPGVGDTATIQNTHTVTVTANQSVGTSPASDTGVCIVQTGGALTINAGITLTIFGGLKTDGPIVVGAGGGITFNGAVGQLYTCQIGTFNNSTGAKITFNGSAGSRCFMNVVASTCTVSFDDGLGNLQTGYLDANYTDFTRLGNATKAAWSYCYNNTSAMKLNISNCVWDTCSGINSTNSFVDGLTWQIINSTWQNSISSTFKFIYVNSSNGVTYTTGTRLIQNCVFDLQVRFYSAKQVTCTGTLFLAGMDATNGKFTQYDSNFSYSSSTTEDIIDGDVTNSYFCKQGALVNPHYLVGLGNQNDSYLGNIFEMPDGTDGAGDTITMPTPAVARTLTVKHNITLQNASGSDSGTPVSALGNANISLIVEHNTYQGAQGANFGETYTGYAGMVQSFKNNIAWSLTPNTAFKAYGNAGAAVSDYVTSANADYNGGYNLQAGTNGKGYTGLTFSSGSPGVHDLFNIDPQFVDPTRGIIKWDTSLGGPGTTAHAIAQLSAINTPSYNSAYSIAALITYVKAGFVPQNSAYFIATDNISPSFGWLGAMQGAVAAMPVLGYGTRSVVPSHPRVGPPLLRKLFRPQALRKLFTDLAASIFSAAQTESSAATESASATVTSTVAQAETAAATETETASMSATAAQTESVAATETETATMSAAVAQAETAAATETETATMAASAAQTETAAATETETTSMSATVAQTETAAATTLQDGVIFAGNVSGAQTETAAVTDSATSTYSAIASMLESAATGESSNRTAVINCLLAESSAIVDVPAATAVMIVAIAEAMALVDVITAAVTVSASQAESAAATDATDGHVTLVLSAACAELMILLEYPIGTIFGNETLEDRLYVAVERAYDVAAASLPQRLMKDTGLLDSLRKRLLNG